MTTTSTRAEPGAAATAADVGSLDPVEERAWRSYQRMQMRVGQHLARELAAEADLSDADLAVLAALDVRPGGRRRTIDLRRAVEWEKSRLSHQLRRMESRGLVEREAAADDGRGADVVLTPTGRAAVAAARCSRARSIRRHLLAHLTPAQVAELAEIADTVNAGLDAACPAAADRE
ncbi:MarR family winged helix-turn-helix transcriptional regulator [Cellulomonas sp. PhB143]|uniref:MarR family winged helix-turn-helix transcriptional regulator n=1 Tax=Cellulomonas sp. PhB143 TaxID=2485186 RepID=UPI000F48D563|nr:MarR family winged helix-turn-helix transcriptional regulator [Cellulomonas sp. PhB143]ROS75267.1 MarR family protein [Cellulomonas sp. PhB143]